ncbi:hypothetical protein BV25DRAFT_730740 [Artomyces pyxidatus]|uniref:Uncharacterized protein n=1 Tax=Artomyces pyxidatus TaxID=48021 RepID=A0ACB8SZ37_9AGAM|nr:hypothetical protein BV25DRAFT_730740 [Artomyces pyxidatus]
MLLGFVALGYSVDHRHFHHPHLTSGRIPISSNFGRRVLIFYCTFRSRLDDIDIVLVVPRILPGFASLVTPVVGLLKATKLRNRDLEAKIPT